ncbi:amidohydrolase family protein [Corynebacterium sphenisci]|uniref:amidohydrolase family protein n=1 Tax=Corynebacterium sphenisci TaxID=191493 RepID=UPI0026E0936E|nr:amidohydrolase family protein [Corynebacterium sphenisci]MDO5731003.1 amidohydrolase family protein [Corynebacterium sphenisci]
MDIIDAHFHVIAARDLQPELPDAPRPFPVDAYLQAVGRVAEEVDWARFTGGVVVGGSRRDRARTLVEALEQLELEAAAAGRAPADGGRAFIGMITGTADLGAERVLALDARGVRAVRFNLLRGQEVADGDLLAVAHRVHDLAGWATDVAVDVTARPGLVARLPELDRVCVNHLGMAEAGVDAVVDLAARGVRVKATGFGRLPFPPADALRRIHRANPGALIFGTDLPGTRAERRFGGADLELLLDVLGEWELPRVLHDNARALYRFADRR